MLCVWSAIRQAASDDFFSQGVVVTHHYSDEVGEFIFFDVKFPHNYIDQKLLESVLFSPS